MMKNTSAKAERLREQVTAIRRTTLDLCVEAKTGCLASSLSVAEVLVSLYHGRILRYNVAKPEWEERDRFILSKGHAAPILYAVLADIGFISSEMLGGFCHAGGCIGIHCQHNVPGVEVSSGSLGHGLGIGAGLALAAKIDIKPFTTFVLLGDGECNEGSVWEAIMFASHHALDNLIAIVDRNRLCSTAFTKDVIFMEPLAKKWEAFGWETRTIDGHCLASIQEAFADVHARRSGKPLVIIAETTKGKGVSFLENDPMAHGAVPKGDQIERARCEISR